MRQRGIATMAVVLIILNLSLIALTGWKIWQFNQPVKPTPPLTAEQIAASNAKTFTSVNEAFSLTFPAGWDGVLRLMDSDRFVVLGPTQPVLQRDIPAVAKDIAYLNNPDQVLFEAAIDDDFKPPQGDANDLLIGKDKYLLSGRRYVYTYEGNDVSTLRTNGDKDYIYSFALGGKRELRVTYRIYADDPTDNSKVVEGIVRSIRKLK